MSKNEKIAEESTKNGLDTASKVEAIRDLIFGENIKEYNEEFETLKKDIQKKKSELEELVEEVRKDVLEALDNASTDIGIRITELEEKTEDLGADKMDKKALGELLIELGKKVSAHKD